MREWIHIIILAISLSTVAWCAGHAMAKDSQQTYRNE